VGLNDFGDREKGSLCDGNFRSSEALSLHTLMNIHSSECLKRTATLGHPQGVSLKLTPRNRAPAEDTLLHGVICAAHLSISRRKLTPPFPPSSPSSFTQPPSSLNGSSRFKFGAPHQRCNDAIRMNDATLPLAREKPVLGVALPLTE
jgi:hypothetical protein